MRSPQFPACAAKIVHLALSNELTAGLHPAAGGDVHVRSTWVRGRRHGVTVSGVGKDEVTLGIRSTAFPFPPGALSAGETSRPKIATVAVATKSFLIPIPLYPSRRASIGAWEAGTYMKGIGTG